MNGRYGKQCGPHAVVHHVQQVDCQVLFVNSSDESFLQALHEKLKDRSVLSIGESEQFPWTGGVIRFYDEDNKVRFEINQEAAEQARLKISSKLLQLAKIFAK